LADAEKVDELVNTRRTTSWLLPLFLACVLIGVIAMRYMQRPAPPAVTTNPEQRHSAGGEVVSLSIDFGKGATRSLKPVAWRDGMTVEKLMADAMRRDPEFSYEQRGIGGTAFLTQIDGIGGRSGERRYWQYWVNNKRADRSFGAYELRSGDHVLWRFAPE
jgi:hypothetical protein